jgi:hypothetical protein
MRILFSSILLIAFCGVAAAEDKPAALSGTWTRESGGLDLKIEFSGKDALKMSAFHDENGAIVTCKYTVKDGLVKAKVTKVEIKGDFKAAPKEGIDFTFKWKVKHDTGTLDDFTAGGMETAKPVIEGEYVKKKGKD